MSVHRRQEEFRGGIVQSVDGLDTSRSGSYIYKESTTDATATVVHAEPIAEAQCAYIIVEALGQRGDASESIRTNIRHLFKREAEGDVTVQGTAASVTANTSSGTPTVTIVANTTDQTADVTVTGEAAKDFEWTVEVKVIK